MELFFNLLWLALSFVLFGLWLLHKNRWADDRLRFSVGMQFVALALLIIILLPVVSLTDDLHASAMLADSDHLWKRGDFQAIAHFALHTLAAAIAGRMLFNISPQSRIVAWLSFPPSKETPCAGFLHVLGSRPPPAV